MGLGSELTQLGVTTIALNSARHGGGVFVYGNAKLNGGRIISNSANGEGGGVYVYRQAELSGTCILNNSATNGGGIAVEPGPNNYLTATNGCVVNNTDTAVVGTLSATKMWWGAKDGPSGAGPGKGDSVGPNVAYAPFITETPSNCPERQGESPPNQAKPIYLPLVIKGS